MKVYKQAGNVLPFTAPAGGVTSGTPVLIGTLLVVPVADAAAGEQFNGYAEGVHELAKKSTDVFTEGAAAYWDNTNEEFTTTSAGNTLRGVAVEAAGNPSDLIVIRLNGISV